MSASIDSLDWLSFWNAKEFIISLMGLTWSAWMLCEADSIITRLEIITLFNIFMLPTSY
jgi:hypothetical protein